MGETARTGKGRRGGREGQGRGEERRGREGRGMKEGKEWATLLGVKFTPLPCRIYLGNDRR